MDQERWTAELRVNFRCLAKGQKCTAGERMLKVLADGSVKTICYTFTMEKWLADIILSDAEKQQAASEKREQPKKERESKKGGKH